MQLYLFIDRNTTVYFDSFGTEYIPLKLLKKSKINHLFTIYLENKIMNLLCVEFGLKRLRRILYYLNLKWMIVPELLSIRIFLVKFKLNIGQEKYLLSILFWKKNFQTKTNPWSYKIEDFKKEKIIGSFYEKELLLRLLL